MELKQLWEPAVLYPVIGISPREDILSREGSAPAASLAHSPLSPVPAHTEVVGELSPSASPLTGGGRSPVYEGTSMISPSWSLVGTVKISGAGRLFVCFPHEMMSFLSARAERSQEGGPAAILPPPPAPLPMAGGCGTSAHPPGIGCGRLQTALQKPIRRTGTPLGACANPPSNRLKIEPARGASVTSGTSANSLCSSSSCSSRHGLPRRGRGAATLWTRGSKGHPIFEFSAKAEAGVFWYFQQNKRIS